MPDPEVKSPRRFDRAAAALLVAMVVLAYLPVILHGGFIWDDDQYVTDNPDLRSPAGLLDIWIHPLSIPQYYPVVHSLFWLEYQMWGPEATGFHVVNVLIFAADVVLLWQALRRMGIPGAYLAAALFAVHPVNVESVAWITEGKNVLSLLFYLLCLLAALPLWGLGKEDSPARASAPSPPPLPSPGVPGEGEMRGASPGVPREGESLSRSWRRRYAVVMGLFIAALLSKSVTCSLPAAIALLIYFKRGVIRRREIWPLLPMLAVGAAMAWVTGYIERRHVGAAGPDWQLSVYQRCLIAGRALWFYAGKLLLPRKLTFIYPKWDMTGGHPWLIAYPLAAVALLAAAWLLRRKIGRGPLVALLFFGGTLLPALGFADIYPMRYSYVADHFQFHASMGLIALAAAGMSARWILRPVAIVLVIALAALTWKQCRIYQNELTLWNDTIDKNPGCWMAWGNCGDVYAALSGQPDISIGRAAAYRALARRDYWEMYQLAPGEPMAHFKWGAVLEYDGDYQGAEAEYRRAVANQPDFAMAFYRLALVLEKQGRDGDAMSVYQQCLAIRPDFEQARANYERFRLKAGDQ